MAWQFLSDILLGGRTGEGRPYEGLFGSGGQWNLGTTAINIADIMDMINRYQAGEMTVDKLKYMSEVYYGQAGGYKLTNALLNVRKQALDLEKAQTKNEQLDRWIHKFGSSRARMAAAGIDIVDQDPLAIPMTIATALIAGQAEEEYDTNFVYSLREFNEITIPRHMAKIQKIEAETSAKLYALEAKKADIARRAGLYNDIALKIGNIGSSMSGGLRISGTQADSGFKINQQNLPMYGSPY